jgi:hypothetical protein
VINLDDGTIGVMQTWLYVGGGSGTFSGLNAWGLLDDMTEIKTIEAVSLVGVSYMFFARVSR